MSLMTTISTELQARQTTALESIADSLKGIAQDLWEIRELMEERERKVEAAGE